MRRVAVIGCGGSGTTTVSRELGRILPVLHIDRHYWRGASELASDEWLRIHGERVAGERWGSSKG